RETRTAEAETFLALHDNGDGSYSGRFRIPELHGHLLGQALDRLTAPRRLTRDRHHRPVVDESAPGHHNGAHRYETHGAALWALSEHPPTTAGPGLGGNSCEVIAPTPLDALLTGLDTTGPDTPDLDTARLDPGVTTTAGQARRLACNAGLVPAVLDGT